MGIAALAIGSLLIFLLENLYSSYLFLRSVDVRDAQAKSQGSDFSFDYPCIAHDDMNLADVDLIFQNCSSPVIREFLSQVTIAFIGDSHGSNLLKGAHAFCLKTLDLSVISMLDVLSPFQFMVIRIHVVLGFLSGLKRQSLMT